MSFHPAPVLRSVMAPPTARWLWTWGGLCFWYRKGQSLFTHDGIEVGRFAGTEVYAPDGCYLGELKKAPDGERLIASSYKKARTRAPFVPAAEHPRERQSDRKREAMYCGYEDFPSPETVLGMVLKFKRELERYINADSPY